MSQRAAQQYLQQTSFEEGKVIWSSQQSQIRHRHASSRPVTVWATLLQQCENRQRSASSRRLSGRVAPHQGVTVQRGAFTFAGVSVTKAPTGRFAPASTARPSQRRSQTCRVSRPSTRISFNCCSFFMPALWLGAAWHGEQKRNNTATTPPKKMTPESRKIRWPPCNTRNYISPQPASSCSSDGINTPNKACRNSDAVSVCPRTFTGKSAAWLTCRNTSRDSLPVHCPNGLYLLQLRTLSIPEVSSSRHCCLKLPDMENTRQSILWDLGKTHKENVYSCHPPDCVHIQRHRQKKNHHLGHSCHVILAKIHIDPDVESLLT